MNTIIHRREVGKRVEGKAERCVDCLAWKPWKAEF